MIRPCPICDSQKIKILYKQSFIDHFTHNISSCQTCGFVYISNTPKQGYYDNYYKKSSKYEGIREHEPHDEITNRVVINFIKRKLKKNASILDVGCSTGNLLELIKKEGFKNLYGFDPAPMCKKIAYEKNNLKIDTCDILSYKGKMKFDFIILSQVLEHITDLKKNVNKINSLVADNGYVFIGIPNLINSKLNYGEPYMEFSTEHINFFSINSLYYLMQKYSCQLIKTNSLVFISIWKKDNKFENSIIKYINLSNDKIKKINRTINSISQKIIVWGAGAVSQKLLKKTKLKSKIIIFVDSNKHLIGTNLNGIEIISPERLINYSNPILIASFRYKKEIIEIIKKKKITNKIIIL